MDCYLCGASNPDDADFCHKCDGQLLKIGALEPEEPVEVEGELVVELDQEFEDEAPTRRRTMRSLEHSRLEAALGLGDDLDPEDEPEAPTFSNVGNPGNIPMIGTRTAPVSFETSGGRAERGGKFIYVMLALLTAAVAWLGYQTLVIGNEGPENLAFNETAVEFNTAPVTVPEARPWTESEVSSKFARAFVTVKLYDCPAEIKDKTEADSERSVQGIAINNHSVIFNSNDIRGADAASIRTQLGFSEIALISRSTEGFAIATTHRNLTRNLALSPDPEGTDTYFMSYDTQLNLANIDIKPSASDLEVSITEHGQPTSLRVKDREVSLESLLELSAMRAEYEDSKEAEKAHSVCARSQFLTDPDEPARAEEPADNDQSTEESG